MANLCFDYADSAKHPMNDGSVNHGRILRNLLRLLDATCCDSFYEVLPRGVQLWIPTKGLGLYPDVMVVAGEPLLDHGRSDRVINPCLVFEILSEPTEAFDPLDQVMGERSSLFTHCRSIPYLQEYIFIHQNQALVEQFSRAQENLWGLTTYRDFDTVVELNVTNARLPVMDVYDRVEFTLQV